MRPIVGAALVPVSRVEEEYLSGLKKRRLVEWWLNLVESSVESFLTRVSGYDANAVPYDYIDRKPHSLAQVEQNLQIIRSLIAPPCILVRAELVDELRRVIYEQVDLFLSVARLLCSRHSRQLGYDVPLTARWDEILESWNSASEHAKSTLLHQNFRSLHSDVV
jgi:hypothetical protein